MKTETIALSDIQVGDVIKVTLDADGNATAVVVMNSGAPEKPEDTEDTKEDSSKDDSKDSSDSTEDDSASTTDTTEESK